MAQEIINVGATPNDGLGDPIRNAFIKCNNNFTELFSGSSNNAISNGNSIVQISTANGNISMSVSGTANVAVVTTTGITVSNTVAAANLTSAGAVSATGNITGGNILTVGNITGGNILTVGNITGGNIDAVNLVINNISSDDSTFITIEDGVIVNGVISAAGNIAGANITAFGNAFVNGVVNANLVLASGVGVPFVGVTTFNLANARATTINFGGAASNIFIANVNSTTQVAGNLTAGGTVSATGNVTANNFVGAGAGTTTLSATTNLDLSANTAVRVTGGATFRLPSLDASQIANIVAANGDMIYNTTVNKIQGYEAGAWGNLI